MNERGMVVHVVDWRVVVVVYGEYSHDDDYLITLPEPTTSSVESHVFNVSIKSN